MITGNNYVTSWQSEGLSNETIKPPTTSDNSLTPVLIYYNFGKIKVKLTGSCLKQPTPSITQKIQ